jgi:hypothetical protein
MELKHALPGVADKEAQLGHLALFSGAALFANTSGADPRHLFEGH